MIVLLGASGYVGQAFAQALRERDCAFTGLARHELDYTVFDVLLAYLQRTRPSFLINAAGFTGKPNVDACESARAQTLGGNTLLPQTIAQACSAAGVPWGHVSSGCIYSGAKVRHGAGWRAEKDLMQPEIQAVLNSSQGVGRTSGLPVAGASGPGRSQETPETGRSETCPTGEIVSTAGEVRARVDKDPECIQGYTENDPPNFSFRDPPCSFYSGTKALAEEAIAGVGRCYLWRLRIPFDEWDNSRNYLSKVQRYNKVYNNVNSLSHRGDFVRACLDLWQQRAPFGTYNVTNPGFVTTRQVIGMIERILAPSRSFEFWANDAEFYRLGAGTPRSNCVLDVSKMLAAGVRMRPVQEALEDALRNWQPQQA